MTTSAEDEASSTGGHEPAAAAAAAATSSDTADKADTTDTTDTTDTASRSVFANGLPLPRELVGMILAYFTPIELCVVSEVCKSLYIYATADHLWRVFVQDNVPGTTVTSPRPCNSFRELYVAHDPYWFISRYKIWFSGHDLIGKVIIARFNPVKARIEGYRLVPIHRSADDDTPSEGGSEGDGSSPMLKTAQFILFTGRSEIMLDPIFKPRRILKLGHPPGPSPLSQSVTATESSALASTSASASTSMSASSSSSSLAKARAGKSPATQPLALRDVPMVVKGRAGESGALHKKLVFAKRLPPELMPMFSPSAVWPPPRIPAPHRVMANDLYATELLPTRTYNENGVLGAAGGMFDSSGGPQGAAFRPYRRADLSDHAFHIRTWIDSSPTYTYRNDDTVIQHEAQPHAQRRVDELHTFATVDPIYYTPTADKPFRGIFIADYHMHGYELVLIHQPDDTEPFDEAADVSPQLDTETAAQYDQRRRDARINRGRLEAIKLTGDPNVPRGEITFVAPDLGAAGVGAADGDETSLSILDGTPLATMRSIHCRGHVAHGGFQNDRFIDCRLFLVSANQLALFWVVFNRVMYYNRVDIDFFVQPEVTRRYPVSV